MLKMMLGGKFIPFLLLFKKLVLKVNSQFDIIKITTGLSMVIFSCLLYSCKGNDYS